MGKQSHITVEQRIIAVAELLEVGASTADIIDTFCPQWSVTSRTVDNYIARAKAIVRQKGKERGEALEAARAEAATKANVLSDIELEEKLCAIIRGEMEVERKIITDGREKIVRYKPTAYEVILAIDKLWKKRGAYPLESKQQVENQNVVIQYNLQKPEDAKYIENV